MTDENHIETGFGSPLKMSAHRPSHVGKNTETTCFNMLNLKRFKHKHQLLKPNKKRVALAKVSSNFYTTETKFFRAIELLSQKLSTLESR